MLNVNKSPNKTPLGCKNWFIQNTCLKCSFEPNGTECNNYINTWELEKVYS